MKLATVDTLGGGPRAAPRPPGRNISVAQLGRWIPLGFVVLYAAVLLPELPALVAHSWWSADSASAGVVAQLYSHPAAGQYIVLGDHGWYEALASYLLTRWLPAHRLLWYCAPVAVWVLTIGLIGFPSAKAFGRYGAALAVGALLCMAPTGLLTVFEPTAHTDVIFTAALLAAGTGWVLPRIRSMSTRVVSSAAILAGAVTGLALAGDMLAVAWAVLPFAITVGVCAWRGPVSAVGRTLAFGWATLTTTVVVAVLFSWIMHGAGFRVDELAGTVSLRFVKSYTLASNFGTMLNGLGYMVGGAFFGRQLDRRGLLDMISGGTLLVAAGAVLFAARRAIVAAGPRPNGGTADEITPKLVHVTFWVTCLTAGVFVFVFSSAGSGSGDYRYLVGPVVAVAALVPLAAARSRGWRIAVGAGLSVMALAGLAHLATESTPYPSAVDPLSQRDMTALERFAQRYHVSDGYAVYWDAATITWHTDFQVNLHVVVRCGPTLASYCPSYHSDSFTAAYIPKPGLRTMFVADRRYRSSPDPAWGKPLASRRIGRLTAYVYGYDLAYRFPKPARGELERVITGS